VRRPALLHQDRREPRVAGSGVEQCRQHARPQARVEVVGVALQHDLGRHRLTEDQPQYVRRLGRVAPAGTRTDGVGAHRRQGALPGQRGEQRGPGRGAGLVGQPAGHRSPPHDLQYGWRGHRYLPVPGRDGASGAPDLDRSTVEVIQSTVNGQPLDTGAGRDHIGERVQGAHLVEVHLLRCDPVHRGLGPTQ
jgi:hypothetical protein